MEGIEKYLPHLFKERVLADGGKHGDILRRILYVNVDGIGVLFILRGCGLHNGVKNSLLAGEMVVKGRRFNAYCFGDLTHADRVVTIGRKQLESLFQNLLLGIFLFHAFLTN